AFVVKNSAMAAVAYLPFALFIGVGLFAIWQWRMGAHFDCWRVNGTIIIVTLFALGAYLEIYPRADTYHVIRALPPAFLLIVLLLQNGIAIWKERLQTSSYLSRNTAYLCSAIPIVLFILVGIINSWLLNFDSHLRFIDRQPLEIERGRGIL